MAPRTKPHGLDAEAIMQICIAEWNGAIEKAIMVIEESDPRTPLAMTSLIDKIRKLKRIPR